MKPQRMRLTHELLSVYGMLDKMHLLRAKRATAGQMTKFHTDEYVHFLSRVTPETAEDLTYHGTRFLVGEDNPPWEGVFDFCSLSAGGSIEGAQRIASGAADIAINWAGGLHHAKKREASGFCYINDIVLGILELLRVFPRVLYIDIDCHHGDGVEEAFYSTNRVMTCSFHKFGEYFPGTGTQEDRGRGEGRGYAVNVPFKDGLTDEAFQSVFEPVVTKIMEVFQPSAIVLQCGADSLAGDKLGCLNITMKGHANCVQFVRKLNVPLMLLGGGGYTVKNVARTWTYETACALGIEDTIDPNLPWNEYFEWFGPRYRLEVLQNNMDDLNVKDKSLDKVRETALKHLSELRPAPSVGLQDVPSESLGEHLGFRSVRHEKVDELDERLAQHTRFVYGLQDSSASSSSEPESDSDASDSRTSRAVNKSSRRRHVRNGKKRMSIMTNQLYDIGHSHEKERLEEGPNGYHDFGYGWAMPVSSANATNARTNSRRRFFQSSAKWDDRLRRVLVEEEMTALGLGAAAVGQAMENGGRRSQEASVAGDDEEMDVEDDDEEN